VQGLIDTGNDLIERPDVDPDQTSVEREFAVGELDRAFLAQKFAQPVQRCCERLVRRVTVDAWPQRLNHSFFAHVAAAVGDDDFQEVEGTALRFCRERDRLAALEDPELSQRLRAQRPGPVE